MNDEAQIKVLEDWGWTYIGKSTPWTNTSEEKWKIIRMDDDWNKEYPEKDWEIEVKYNLIWDDVLTYNYFSW